MKTMLSIALVMLGVGMALAPTLARAQEKLAVVVVDLQKDFTTAHKGSLAVAGADQAYLAQAAQDTAKLKKAGLAVYATQDWHPADHMSFAANQKGKKPFETMKLADGRVQVLWPVHCVQNSPGSQILLDQAMVDQVVRKGMDPKFDSYSGFKDDGGKKTGLAGQLKAAGVTKLIVYGLATDYCVKATVLDAMAAGFKVVVLQDLCRGVAPDTSQAAWKEMAAKGVELWPSLDLAKLK